MKMMNANFRHFSCRRTWNRDPQPCDFRRWWKDKWWSSASETFNFASNNWEKESSRLSPEIKNGLSI